MKWSYVPEVSKNIRFVEFEGYHGVPCVNASHVHMTEILESLLRAFEQPIALGWWLRGDGLVQVEIRTRAGSVNATKLAKRWGGNGQKYAAGFQAGMARWAQVVTR